MDFCAMNVAVYTPQGKLWALTEWPRASVRRAADHVQIGPNAVGWRDDHLEVRFDERRAPFGGSLRGRLRLFPQQLFAEPYTLDDAGQHGWCPVAPIARVRLELEAPALVFEGSGYHDANYGATPLEDAFLGWSWSRAELGAGAAILYDVDPCRGARRRLGLLFGRDGVIRELEAPQEVTLPPGRWREPRATRADAGARVEVVQTLESSPFYARSLLQTRLAGEPCLAVHEALSLTRFAAPWVQALLPFKTRRRSRRSW